MITNSFKQKMLYLLIVGVGVAILFFVVMVVWIGYEVKSTCQNAKWQYGGDCVTAVAAQLDDEKQGYRIRNHAIWALGQLGDSRALPVLEKYYTGNIPDREPLDNTISQYELKKAIDLASGGQNIAAWAWRWGLK